ncbi:MAG: alpha/beta hydrolase [Actinobacteria bacterium]|nr:alpha/beta hydrolase [Actinomycetota bacterium]
METDADDVRRLIQHLDDEPSAIFGNSSGALVGLQLLIQCPDIVGVVIAHEPPWVRLLPDGEAWVVFFETVYATYRTSGVHPALQQFGEGVAGRAERVAMARARDPNNGSQVAANVLYWFERELRQYTNVDLDVDALAAYSDRLVLAGGRESKQQVTYQPNAVLAARFGKDIADLPGGHVGFVMHPAEFAAQLLDLLGNWPGLGP